MASVISTTFRLKRLRYAKLNVPVHILNISLRYSPPTKIQTSKPENKFENSMILISVIFQRRDICRKSANLSFIGADIGTSNATSQLSIDKFLTDFVPKSTKSEQFI